MGTPSSSAPCIKAAVIEHGHQFTAQRRAGLEDNKSAHDQTAL